MSPNNDPKVHLMGRRWKRDKKAACGLCDPKRKSRQPSQVTCGSCKRTPYMADREIEVRRRSSSF